MSRLIHAAVIIGCLFLATLLLTAVDFVMNMESISGAEEEQLLHGRIESWFRDSTIWSRYPAWGVLSRPEALFSSQAVLMTAPLFLVLYYLLRLRKRYSLITVGLFSLLAGTIPYVSGRLALLYNTEPLNAGPWITLMLLGALYATLGCMLFTFLGLLLQQKSAVRKEVRVR